MLVDALIAVAVSYLAGSVPFGLLVTSLAGYGDVRSQGSGNIGATNVVRLAGKKIGVVVFLLDFLKCYVPVAVFSSLESEHWTVAGVLVAGVLGHVFPVWLKGRGGKGVASFAGATGALSFYCLLVFALTWVLIFAWKRISGLSSLGALATTVMVAAPMALDPVYVCALAVVGLVCVCKHKRNIQDMLSSRRAS